MRVHALPAFLLLLAAVGLAQEPEILGLERFGGSPRARETLLERGFVVTDETCHQIFSFYIGQDRVFVTTDCLLHAYFVNLEESLRGLESRQREGLGRLLGTLETRLGELRKEGEESLDRLIAEKKLDPGWGEAADAVADYLLVAKTLATGAAPPADGPVAEEIALILAADKDAVSPLRGVPLAYGRFDPSAAPDARFHRAITWLYEVPFRIADEQETRQAMVLAAISHSETGIAAYCREFLGAPDDLDIGAYVEVFRRKIGSLGDLAREPKRWERAMAALRRLPDPRHPTTPVREVVEDPARFKGLRFLARPSLIDNDVFKALAPFGLDRPPPSGEELMATLGSAAAESVVRSREGTSIPGYDRVFADARAAAKEAAAAPLPVLYQAQLAVFRSLLDRPARDDLPAYYLHPDWRYKDLNTCLAGWAHHRFIWGAHAKRHIYYGGLVRGPRGIIEPNEAFFGALLDLTVATGRLFRRHGVEEHRFDDLAELLVELRVELRAQLEGRAPGPEQAVFEDFGPRVGRLCGFPDNTWLVDDNLPDHTFAVPVSRDLLTRAERWVGQARPRALYVVAEHAGRRFVFIGGVLSYRDQLAPSEGEGRMTLERWREGAAADALPAPAWQARYGVPFSDEELLAEARAGRIRRQALLNPPAGLADILAERLRRGGEFTLESGVPDWSADPRRSVIALLARIDYPRLVELLFPMLAQAPGGGTYYGLGGWPEARALAGRLGEEHIPALLEWARGEHRQPHLLFALIATIPGARAQEVVLDYLDRTQAEARGHPKTQPSCAFAAVASVYVGSGGLEAGRVLFERCDRYGETARAILLEMLARRWPEPLPPGVLSSAPPPDYSVEERAFAQKLHERLRRESD